jgi:polyphosphate kinase
LAGLLALGGPAFAHPHMFVDAGLQLIFDDDGRLAALRIVWAYDSYSSLLTFEDMELDPDYDGVLTEAELDRLRGFDGNWVEGYDGDIVALHGDGPVALGPPGDWTVTVQDGRIVSSHLRPVPDRPDPAAAEIVLRVFDPTYYTAYSIVTAPQIRGRDDCTGTVYGPDLEAAEAVLMDALDELFPGAGPMDVDEDFPAVGEYFADEVRVRCGAPS